MSARGSNLDSRRKRRRRIWRPRLAGVALDLGVGQSRRSNSSPILSPNVQIRVPVYCMPGEIGLQRRSYSNMTPKYCVRNACRSFYPCTRLKQAKKNYTFPTPVTKAKYAQSRGCRRMRGVYFAEESHWACSENSPQPSKKKRAARRRRLVKWFMAAPAAFSCVMGLVDAGS